MYGVVLYGIFVNGEWVKFDEPQYIEDSEHLKNYLEANNINTENLSFYPNG